ncbi:MAG: MnmA/TRMU family protein, partial [Gammaproteobacteria bacterium]
PGKDQSYFLHAVAQAALARTLFPLGDMLKQEVRRRAHAAGFANHAKKDSTGICFIGERKFAAFLSRYLPAQPGAIETSAGEIIGTHRGLMYYTLGQRHGLGVGGRRDAASAPWYVAFKDLQRNVLIVVQGHDHPLLQQQSLLAEQLHWISGAPPARRFDCTAKNRYRQTNQACRVTIQNSHRCQVAFEHPQRALTPGQYVVFYRGEECLGGGVIANVGTPTIAAHARSAA